MNNAIDRLKRGQVIAYPTEAVFGLGCDPAHQPAVDRLLRLKNRSYKKGLILVADAWAKLEPFVRKQVPIPYRDEALSSWPGPITWLFPADLDRVPLWVRGDHTNLALRVSAHPVVRRLSSGFGGPLVSTSANREGQPPARTPEAVRQSFDGDAIYVCPGEVGGLAHVTPIRSAIDGRYIRRIVI